MSEAEPKNATEAASPLTLDQVERIGGKLFIDAAQYFSLLTPIGTPLHTPTILTVCTLAVAHAIAWGARPDAIGNLTRLVTENIEAEARRLAGIRRENLQ